MRPLSLSCVVRALISACGSVVALGMLCLPCLASTLTVTSLADDGSAGTLRATIASASPGDAITFAVTGTITLTQGTIEVNKNLTISGPGPSNLAISGNNQATVFQVDAGVTVSISGMTVENGTACTSFSCNGDGGGGIRNKGTLSVNNTVIKNSGTGCNCNGGGGIRNDGTLTVTNSTLQANGAAYGGGIGNWGSLTVIDSTFVSNGASYGGGIYSGGTGTVVNSTFYRNGDNFTGAGIDGGGALAVKNTLFANNSLVDGVGNPYAGSSCSNVVSGGYNLADDNSCSASLSQPGDLNNTAANVDSNGLQNNGGPTPTVALLSTSVAVNAIPLASCTDAGGNRLAADQRGIARPQDGACDIGAFELQVDTDSGLADLSGGNSFTGNQTVGGSVTATAFFGDGSGLTNITASSANNANYATSAGDAMTLGGIPASDFAPASGSASYVAKAGDTMTGTLSLAPNGLVAGTNQLVLSGGNVGIGTATPEAVSGYTSLHIDNAGTGFGGSFLELTHSPTGAKGRIVMDDNGFLIHALNAATVRIKSGNFNGPGDPGHIFIGTNGSVGIWTGTPTATLEVNGTAKFDGTVTFAPGQVFPGSGSGTITGVTAGTGLSGGGTSGTVTLNNAGILSLAAGNGISSTGGQSPTVSLNTSFTDSRYLTLGGGTLSGGLMAPSFSGGGAGLTSLNPANLSAGTAAINITGNAATATTAGTAANAAALGGVVPSNYARLDIGNTFTGDQNVKGNVTASGNATFNGPFAAGLSAGLFTSGMFLFQTGTATPTQGFPSFPVEFWASSYSSTTSIHPWLNIFQLVAEPTSNNTPNPSATLNLQFITGPTLPPPPSGYAMQETGFSITGQGGVTIGGGTTIRSHVSTLFPNVAFNTKMGPGTCTVWSTPFSSATDGDTVAVGFGSSLMSANIVFSAWATTGSVSVRICNPTGSPTTIGAGNIRIDVWKH